jgi:O-antigen/teichoic acid export membrane protein
MGIIQQQGIRDSIATYTGVALGAINTIFIYPYFLQAEELGLFQFIVSSGMLLSLFVVFGAQDLATRFFPVFRQDSGHHRGLLPLLLLIPISAFLFLLIALGIGYEPFTIYLKNKDPLIQKYWFWVLPTAFFIGINLVLINYTKNFFRIVVPTLIEGVFVKIVTGALSLALFFAWISLGGFAAGIALVYGVVSMGLAGYLMFLGQWRIRPDWSFLQPALGKEMVRFAFFSMLGGFSAGFLTWLDRLMLSLLIEDHALKAVGIFSIAAYMGAVIDIPRRSLEKISAPIVADAFQRRDISHIGMLYQKTSINQLIVGIVLFLLVWINIQDIFNLMPNGERYISGLPIVLILGITSLVSMACGLSHQILVYSPYYQMNFYMLLILALLNIILNYLMIRTLGWGITGAAIATLISNTLYNGFKLIFVYYRFKILPFNRATLKAILWGCAVFLALNWIVMPIHPFFSIALKSIAIVVLFGIPVLYARLSPDLNSLWDSLRARLRI